MMEDLVFGHTDGKIIPLVVLEDVVIYGLTAANGHETDGTLGQNLVHLTNVRIPVLGFSYRECTCMLVCIDCLIKSSSSA
jgi:hypothetical protein